MAVPVVVSVTVIASMGMIVPMLVPMIGRMVIAMSFIAHSEGAATGMRLATGPLPVPPVTFRSCWFIDRRYAPALSVLYDSEIRD
jgi:hypothetical protein